MKNNQQLENCTRLVTFLARQILLAVKRFKRSASSNALQNFIQLSANN